MLARKGLFIVFLISLIAAYFYVKPLFNKEKDNATIEDRLPTGDFIGKVMILDLARETNSFIFFNKLPFREFLTVEFILSQGKSYGVDVQKPAYFFANQTNEWGSLLSVKDSSKILLGIQKLKQNISILDTLVGGKKVYKLPEQQLYMTYGKNWLFVYSGNQLTKRMYHVLYSKKGDIHPIWKKLLKNPLSKKESLVVASNWREINQYGIEEAIFTHDSDSSLFTIKSYFKSKKPFDVSLKNEGIALPTNQGIDKSITFHFDVSKIRRNLDSPLRKLISNFSKRISFPVDDFLKAWEGDITFQEGGKQKIKETVIETVYDEDFNATDVKKETEVEVPGYTLLLSMNAHQKQFVSKLFAKGIMRQEGRKFYILTSPPLIIRQTKTFLLLHSSGSAPKIITNAMNGGYWSHKKTPYEFVIDSLNQQELVFSVRFPGMRLFSKKR